MHCIETSLAAFICCAWRRENTCSLGPVGMAWHGVVWAFLCRYIRIALTFSIEESETAEDRQPHGWYSVDLRHGAAQGFSWPGVCEACACVCACDVLYVCFALVRSLLRASESIPD